MRPTATRPTLLLPALTAAFAVLFLAPPPADAHTVPALRVDYISGAHGDASVYRTACGEQVLVDAGRGLADAIVDNLTEGGNTHLDYVMPSHADTDHLGDVVPVVTSPGITVGTYADGFTAPDNHTTDSYAAYWATSRERGTVRTLDIGDAIDLCDATVRMTVVSVGYDGTAVNDLPVQATNDRGVCLLVEVSVGYRHVTCGDINGSEGAGLSLIHI